MNILIAILIFSILILFHEFGHFLTAKLCGVAVIEFSLGMGPRILSHVSARSGTRYSWKALPFGGSCMMKGEEAGSEESDEGPEEERDAEPDGDMDEPAVMGGSFAKCKVWQRMLIVAAGPVFNFLLAFLFSIFLIGAAGYDPPVVLKVSDGFPAREAGIAAGDEITQIGNARIFLYRDISDYVYFHQAEMASGKRLKICWKHQGEEKTASIVPAKSEDGRYLIGISGTSAYRVRGNAFTTLRYSAVEVGYWIRTTVKSLEMLLRGQVSSDEVSGPVGVVKAVSDTVEESKSDGAYYVWLNLLQISILLTANLGVMNLLPVPALDGGRLLFLILEAITRRKIRPKVEAAINYAGFVFLMGLMVIVLLNDTRKLF